MLEPTQTYSRQNTVVISFFNQQQRNLMVKSFSRHNQVFDAFNEHTVLQNILAMPCYIRFVDYETYLTIEDVIIEQYQHCNIESTPPLMVYGLAMEIFDHPLIIDPIKVGSDYCLKLYRKVRRRAKRGIQCT